MKFRPEAMRRPLPLLHGRKLGGKVRFPERDVKDAADAIDDDKLGPLILECRNAFAILCSFTDLNHTIVTPRKAGVQDK